MIYTKEKDSKKASMGNKLRDLRLKSGFTQQNLADALQINRSTYTYYETGKTSPDIYSLNIIAKVLGVPVYELLDDNLEMRLSDSSGKASKRPNMDEPSSISELSAKERTLIALLRALPEEDSAAFLEDFTQKFEKQIKKD